MELKGNASRLFLCRSSYSKTNSPEKGRCAFMVKTLSTTWEKRTISLLPFLKHQGKNNIKANKFSGQKTKLGRAEKKRIANKWRCSTVALEMARNKPCNESLSHATAGISSTQVASRPTQTVWWFRPTIWRQTYALKWVLHVLHCQQYC